MGAFFPFQLAARRRQRWRVAWRRLPLTGALLGGFAETVRVSRCTDHTTAKTGCAGDRHFSYGLPEDLAAFTSSERVAAMFAPRSHFAALVLALLAAVCVQAQLETTVDDL